MKLHRVNQRLVSRPLPDVAAEVRKQLDSLSLPVPQGEIAITSGSRGIANIALITKTVGQWLREKGATPFIVPAMGSHNGATAEGQKAMIESLGINETDMQMEIRSSMDVVNLGSVPSGNVYMDKHCHEAAGVLVLNRIKLHTCFSGPVQSGLMKMMVVGMGKIKSAQTFHNTPTPDMKELIFEMGQVILDSGKIFAGLGILEDGFDQTAEFHAVAPSEIPQREVELLEHHRSYFPTLPIDAIDVLVIDEIGKTFSGTGMDTNVTGYRGIKGFEDLDKPIIRIIAALGLNEKSQGNAIGVGLADFITRRLRNDIDEKKTFINTFTTGDMIRAKIPVTFESDEELIEVISERFKTQRWIFIPNTLHLETIYVSEGLYDEIAANPVCDIDPEPFELSFDDGRHTLVFV